MNWQPIELAPKDGTEVIVCFPLQGDVMLFARWNSLLMRWTSKGEAVLGVAGAVWQHKPEPPQ